jgi:competence protein ComGC
MRKLINSLDSQTLVTVIILVIIILVSFQSIDSISSQTQDRSSAIESVIFKAAVQCYALEGSYPPNLEYLSDNYGIIIDEDQYFYFYESKGANLSPKIEVIKR